jgi:hypothetical protein
MKAIALVILALLIAIATCTKDDGEPDPPVRGLVPCHPDAGIDDPLACPPNSTRWWALASAGSRCRGRCLTLGTPSSRGTDRRGLPQVHSGCTHHLIAKTVHFRM